MSQFKSAPLSTQWGKKWRKFSLALDWARTLESGCREKRIYTCKHSKNKKKNWNKFSNVKDVEQFLGEKRREQSLGILDNCMMSGKTHRQEDRRERGLWRVVCGCFVVDGALGSTESMLFGSGTMCGVHVSGSKTVSEHDNCFSISDCMSLWNIVVTCT